MIQVAGWQKRDFISTYCFCKPHLGDYCRFDSFAGVPSRNYQHAASPETLMLCCAQLWFCSVQNMWVPILEQTKLLGQASSFWLWSQYVALMTLMMLS